MKFANGFELNDNGVGDDQVKAVLSNDSVFIMDENALFGFDSQSLVSEFNDQCAPVY